MIYIFTVITVCFFLGRINAERYRNEILTRFINELDDNELENGYFQQDGATPHCTQQTLNMLAEYFQGRIISRHTAIDYPPRSCDLTPCDFFLWPHLKNSIFREPINNIAQLQERIVEKINEINDHPHLLHNVFQNIVRRVTKCVEVNGGHFEYLL